MNNSFLLLIIIVLGLTSSCNKYLEVQPEASYTETQVYRNESAIQQALNGLYIDMASTALYGGDMSTTIIEILAQRFKSVRDNQGRRDLSVLNFYQYDAPQAQQLFDTIWRKGYNTILAANVFLSKIDQSITNKVLPEANGNLLKGEALAVRAMLHFDLLRLYGPRYSQNSSSAAIPYYTEIDAKIQPLYTASEVLAKVIADLTEAASLLAQDPVIQNGVKMDRNFYSGHRNHRLNYYAVKGLMARAYLWSGNTNAAHSTALAVINEGEKWFPWTTYDAANDPANPDRIFSSEILFGVYNPSMYLIHNRYFSTVNSEGVILVPDSSRLRKSFEGNLNDYRYAASWKIEGKPYRSFFKYAEVHHSRAWRFLQPLLRKSELYYILAETEPNAPQALEYLNTARRRRGLLALESSVNLQEAISAEYQKEFWGEGQLFFYYKRVNAQNIPQADYPYDWAMVTPSYVVPLPLSETTTR